MPHDQSAGGFERLQRELAGLERDELGRAIVDFSTFDSPLPPGTDAISGFLANPLPGFGGRFQISSEDLESELTARQTEVDTFLEANRELFFDEAGVQIREFGADPLLRGVRVTDAVTDLDEVRRILAEDLLGGPTGQAFGEDSPEFQTVLNQELHLLGAGTAGAQIPGTFTFANLSDIPLINFVQPGVERPASTLAGLERRNIEEGLGFGTDRFGVPGASTRNLTTGGRISIPSALIPGVPAEPAPGEEPLGGGEPAPASPGGVASQIPSGRTSGSRGVGIGLEQSRTLGSRRVGGSSRSSQATPGPSVGALAAGQGQGAFELDPLLDPRSTFLRSLL